MVQLGTHADELTKMMVLTTKNLTSELYHYIGLVNTIIITINHNFNLCQIDNE